MRYKIVLQYDGGGYHGWQKQPREPRTVQAAVEKAVSRVTESATAVCASGRTDVGVHALGQVAHFDSAKELPPDRFAAAINHWLPEDIRLIACEEAPADFDARKSAKRKTYEYRMYTGDIVNPLRRTRELFVKKLNIGAMDEAARLLVGIHDFAAFRSSGSSAKTTVREIYEAGVSAENDGAVFRVTGSGFLYNSVRIMAGALIRIGSGESDASVIAAALATGDRRLVPDVAPPYALYLKSVNYRDN